MKTMTPEERFERIERQLEFLASNQAQLTTSVENLRDVAARHNDQIVKLTDVVSSLARIAEEQGRQMQEQGRRIEEQGRRMEEQGRRTDERLNALINVVERYFSDGHK